MMPARSIYFSISTLIICLFINSGKPTFAADVGMMFEPAYFKDGGKHFSDRIRFPKVNSDLDLKIRCDASVDEYGKILQNFCFDSAGQNKPFIDAIYRAAKKAKLTPAIVNGKKVRIWFQYSVVFEKTGDLQNIHIFHHHFHNQDELGLNYSSAQRYDLTSLQAECNIRTPYIIWVLTLVNEDGTAQEIIESRYDERLQMCANNYETMVLNSKFIPAFHDGKPVRSIYLESFFNSSYLRRLEFNPLFNSRSPRLR